MVECEYRMELGHLHRAIFLLGLITLLFVFTPGSATLPGPSAGSESGTTIAVGHESRQDDMPSIAAAPDGSIWVAWLSFDGHRDDIAIRHFMDGTWQNLHWVPGASGDSWLPQVGVDGANRVWVVWSQQLDSNWDLYARRFDPSEPRWGPLIRLSSDPLPDVNPRMWSDRRGRLAVAWQGFRRRPGGEPFRQEPRLPAPARRRPVDGNDAGHGRGSERLGAQPGHGQPGPWSGSPYDSYRNGSYDVFLAQVVGGRVVRSSIPVAATAAFEARATTAVDTEDRVWVAWESGPRHWGKDNGRALGDRGIGSPLGGFREPRIACFAQGRWLEPASPLETVFRPYHTYQPHVFSDGSGSIRVVAMERRTGGPTRDSVLFRKRAYPEYWRGRQDGYWSYWVTHLEGERWTAPRLLPNSKGRSSTRMGAALSEDGNLWMTWPTDNRKASYYHRPYPPAGPRGRGAGSGGDAGGSPGAKADRKRNRPAPGGGTRAPGAHRELSDPHRWKGASAAARRPSPPHGTELGRRRRQRRLLDDYYRYMLDAASLDFGANTEHQGGAWPYWWWYSQKMSDMYHLPGVYVSLFAHERSASYPSVTATSSIPTGPERG